MQAGEPQCGSKGMQVAGFCPYTKSYLARFLVRVSLEQRSIGGMWFFTGTELLPMGQWEKEMRVFELPLKAIHDLIMWY